MKIIDTPYTKVGLWFSWPWPWVRLSFKRRSVLDAITANRKAYLDAVDGQDPGIFNKVARSWKG